MIGMMVGVRRDQNDAGSQRHQQRTQPTNVTVAPDVAVAPAKAANGRAACSEPRQGSSHLTRT